MLYCSLNLSNSISVLECSGHASRCQPIFWSLRSNRSLESLPALASKLPASRLGRKRLFFPSARCAAPVLSASRPGWLKNSWKLVALLHRTRQVWDPTWTSGDTTKGVDEPTPTPANSSVRLGWILLSRLSRWGQGSKHLKNLLIPSSCPCCPKKKAADRLMRPSLCIHVLLPKAKPMLLKFFSTWEIYPRIQNEPNNYAFHHRAWAHGSSPTARSWDSISTDGPGVEMGEHHPHERCLSPTNRNYDHVRNYSDFTIPLLIRNHQHKFMVLVYHEIYDTVCRTCMRDVIHHGKNTP